MCSSVVVVGYASFGRSHQPWNPLLLPYYDSGEQVLARFALGTTTVLFQQYSFNSTLSAALFQQHSFNSTPVRVMFTVEDPTREKNQA